MFQGFVHLRSLSLHTPPDRSMIKFEAPIHGADVHDAAETFETFCYIETALINSYLPLFTTDMITHVGNTYRAFSDA